MVPAVDITPLDFLTKAGFPPGPVALIVLFGAGYLWSIRRLAGQGTAWPALRTMSFVGAELALLVAMVSGLASYVTTSFSIGAIQHILVSMVAPIALVLSAPITLARQAGGPRARHILQKVIESRPARLLSQPAVTWPIYGASLFVLYLSPLYSYSLHHALLRQLIDLETLIAGYLFFWRPIGADRIGKPLGYWMRMLYLILLLPCHTILGMALESQSSRIAPGIGVNDLHTGGGLLWVAGEAAGLLSVIAVFVGWLRSDLRAAQRADQLDEASATAALAHWRATREAAARAASR